MFLSPEVFYGAESAKFPFRPQVCQSIEISQENQSLGHRRQMKAKYGYIGLF